MAVVDDIIAYLDPLLAWATAAAPTPDLVEGPMKELPAACVAVTHYGGEPGEYVMGPSLSGPDLEVARVQVMVRHPLMATAKTRAAEVHALLNNLGDQVLSGKKYHRIAAIDGPPYSLGQDANSNWRRVANYRVEKAAG